MNLYKKSYLLSQPKSFWVLSSLEVCEAFSFYGLGSLLLLFMKHELGYTDLQAVGIFSIFMSMTDVFSLFGGIAADRLFGIKKCVMVGCYTMLVGYLLIPLLPNNLFYIGMGFIVVGSSLFASNSTTMLGLCYKDNEHLLRNKGFTLYYGSLNLGGVLSLIACGILKKNYGWNYGFLVAGLGILIGVLILMKFYKLLPNQNYKIPSSSVRNFAWAIVSISPFIFAFCLCNYCIASHIMPLVFIASICYLLKAWFNCSPSEKRNMLNVVVLSLLLTIFFAAEEQSRSTLVLFSDRHVNPDILGWHVPISSIFAINPLFVTLFCPLFSLLLKGNSTYQQGLKKIISGFVLQASCFAYLLYVTSNSNCISIYYILLMLALMALSELFVGPIVYSLCVDLSPKHLKGSMMGLVTVGYGLSNHLGGYIAKFMSVSSKAALEVSMATYRDGFKTILFMLTFATILTIIWKIFHKNIDSAVSRMPQIQENNELPPIAQSPLNNPENPVINSGSKQSKKSAP